MFSTLLIANRGEIARRVMRTARRMGLKTAAVYSDADAAAAHVREADEAVRLGPAPAAESYLRVDAILEAAKAVGADAIHPGYGFLSENADFAEAVAAAGMAFIGPDPTAIRAMGLKDEAKALMSAAGVPVTPGYQGDDQTEKTLKAAAKEIGYPVLIKAVAGGGGKGMRKVEKAGEFSAALAAAKREAAASFGDDRVLIEKFVTGPRHIEVQVFGDRHGNHVHFFERDCSLQRRHQKVIEEAPAPGMTDEVRAAMTAAALDAARAVDYVNAGTVEFIVDGSGALRPDGFWFMEMNTRLQVEHPVTEMVTGFDLVELQVRVAAGERLPAQADIGLAGHAVEARIYAEDPASGFLPSIGRLDAFEIRITPDQADRGEKRGSDAEAIRIDAAVEAHDDVTPYYDPMIAKVIGHAQTRAEALDGLADVLERSVVAGPKANLGFLARCLRDEDFQHARLDTGLIGRNLAALTAPSLSDAQAAALAGVTILFGQTAAGGQASQAEDRPDPWSVADGWRLNAAPRAHLRFSAGAAVHDLAIFGDASGARVDVGGEGIDITLRGASLRSRADAFASLDVTAEMNGDAVCATLASAPDRDYLAHSGDVWAFAPPDYDAAVETLEAGDDIKAPMPGKVIAVEAKSGVGVKRGDTLIVLEAMKMEHALAAPRDGEVDEVRVKPGDQVKEGEALVRLVQEA